MSNNDGVEFIENEEIPLEDLADEDLDIRNPAHQVELNRRCDKMTDYVLQMCSGNRLDVVVLGVCNAIGKIVTEPAHRPALNYNMEIVRKLARDLEQEVGAIKYMGMHTPVKTSEDPGLVHKEPEGVQ